MRGRHRFLVVLVFVLGVPVAAWACLWDYDTLRQERARFPAALELITGKFLRHSEEFYAWRIQDRLAKLKADPTNLGYHDDLAVAYQKTGQHAKAVETILAKEKIKPGLYETHSNLGTFHILAGDFEQGLPSIDRALAINPDAHFGRERYQKWLVEYARAKRRDGTIKFPLQVVPGGPVWRSSHDFQSFLRERLGKTHLAPENAQAAVKGVLGMMRFANHANPLLLEALGDLLRSEMSLPTDAKRLAARAYLKASYEMRDNNARLAYRKLAEWALQMQTPDPNTAGQINLVDLEKDLAAELADAQGWYAELREKEIGWIRDGKDADAEFDRLYTEEPEALDETAGTQVQARLDHRLVFAGGGVLALLIGFAVLRRGKRKANTLESETGRV